MYGMEECLIHYKLSGNLSSEVN